jgi:hypothetical protein
VTLKKVVVTSKMWPLYKLRGRIYCIFLATQKKSVAVLLRTLILYSNKET